MGFCLNIMTRELASYSCSCSGVRTGYRQIRKALEGNFLRMAWARQDRNLVKWDCSVLVEMLTNEQACLWNNALNSRENNFS